MRVNCLQRRFWFKPKASSLVYRKQSYTIKNIVLYIGSKDEMDYCLLVLVYEL